MVFGDRRSREKAQACVSEAVAAGRLGWKHWLTPQSVGLKPRQLQNWFEGPPNWGRSGRCIGMVGTKGNDGIPPCPPFLQPMDFETHLQPNFPNPQVNLSLSRDRQLPQLSSETVPSHLSPYRFPLRVPRVLYGEDLRRSLYSAPH